MQLLDSDVMAESNTLAEEHWSRISESISVLSAEHFKQNKTGLTC